MAATELVRNLASTDELKRLAWHLRDVQQLLLARELKEALHLGSGVLLRLPGSAVVRESLEKARDAMRVRDLRTQCQVEYTQPGTAASGLACSPCVKPRGAHSCAARMRAPRSCCGPGGAR